MQLWLIRTAQDAIQVRLTFCEDDPGQLVSLGGLTRRRQLECDFHYGKEDNPTAFRVDR